MDMNHQNQFLTEKPLRLFLSYLVPSISATLVTSIYILADTVIVGRGVGAVGIAALNLVLPVFSVYMGTGVLFGVGGSVLFSINRGRGDEKKAREYFTVALMLALAVGVLYIFLFRVFFDPITYFLGRNEVTDVYVQDYGKYLMGFPPVFLMSAFLQAFVRNDGDPRRAMAGVMAGGVTNVVLDCVFVFPMGMGMGGAALATVIGSSLTVVILLTHFVSKKNTLRLVRPTGFFTKCREIVHYGFSNFLLEESSGIVIFLFNRQLLTYVGDLGVMAYSIVSNCALIVNSINNGISQATQPILAVNFGAGRRDRVSAAARYGATAAGVAGVLFTVIGLLFPRQLTYLFVEPTPELLAMAVKAVRIYFLSFLFLGLNVLFSTYFQSIMKPGFSMAICLMRGFVLTSVLVMALPLVFGVDGIWAVMVITEFATLCACLAMKRRADRDAAKGGGLGEEVIRD